MHTKQNASSASLEDLKELQAQEDDRKHREEALWLLEKRAEVSWEAVCEKEKKFGMTLDALSWHA